MSFITVPTAITLRWPDNYKIDTIMDMTIAHVMAIITILGHIVVICIRAMVI